MKLKRKKIGDRNYNLVDSVTGEILANAVQTGEHGRDNYPWEWSLNTGWIFGKIDVSTGKSEESLKNCVDYIQSHADAYGFLKPAGDVWASDIKSGQVYRSLIDWKGRGSIYRYYIAKQDAYADADVTLIPSIDSKGDLVEVMFLPGDAVTLYVEA